MIDRDNLKAFVDGELSPLQMSEIREALDKDPQLAREVEEIANLTNSIRASVHVHSAVGLEDTLAALKRARNPWRVIAGPVAAIGLCGLVCAIVFPVFSQAKMAAKQTRVAMEVSSSSAPLSERQDNTLRKSPAGGRSDGALDFESAEADTGGPAAATKANPRASAGRLTDEAKSVRQHKSENATVVGKTDHAFQPDQKAAYGRMQNMNGATVAADRRPDPGEHDQRVAINVPGTVALAPPQSVAPKPVVLEVDSIREAQLRIANLAGHFDGTVSMSPAQAKGASAATDQLVLTVPAAKAEEAMDVIKTVVTAPMRRREAWAMSDAMAAPVSGAFRNSIVVKSGDPAGSGGGRGGASGGFGGGGIGGGFAGSGAGGPGTPPANRNSQQDRSSTAKAQSTSALSIQKQTYASEVSAARRKPVGPQRSIVIVLRKKPAKPPTGNRR